MKVRTVLAVLGMILLPSATYAQATIRQYQQQGMPTPYPNAAGGSNIGSLPAPEIEHVTPREAKEPTPPVAPPAPLYLPPQKPSRKRSH